MDFYSMVDHSELKRLRKQSFNYFRLDPVDEELEDILLYMSQKLDRITVLTKEWINNEGSAYIKEAALALVELQ